MTDQIHLVECPRDAMQGWKTFIPTEKKIAYINKLLEVGFDTVDFGSFVSPKAIPQMADTRDVLAGLDLSKTRSKLLAIIANERGADEALQHKEISFLGFPLSVSETFQQRNTGSGMDEGFKRVQNIHRLCRSAGKELVVYLSMAFGNPYGDAYSEDIVAGWAERLYDEGIRILSLADTVGVASPASVGRLCAHMVAILPDATWGVHLHATATGWSEKLAAAHLAGCTRFDGALKGIGGCPMANDALVGNMDTEWILHYFSKAGLQMQINEKALQEALVMANEIFQ